MLFRSCGARSYSAIAEWGRNYGSEIAHALGFTHNTPCASTRPTIFGRFDWEVLEATWGVWAARGVAQTPATPEAPEAALAVDGTTRRGSTKPGAPGPHLWAGVAHRLGLTRTPPAVAAQTHASKEVETV